MDDLVQRRDAFLERLLQSTRGTFELFSIYIGVRLGLYEALARGGPQTSTELASRTATAERYVREWLEQQTVAGILEVDDERAEARKRRFILPAAYVEVLVDGFDLDTASADLARANAAAAGLADRVKFHTRDAGDPELAGRYDLVTAFECIHDMSQPVSALKAMRRLAGDRGAVLVVDERVGDTFTAAGTDVEWMMYGWSVLHCLPVGKADTPSTETGTVLRAPTLQRYAEEAGFRRMEILGIDNLFFRFYRLHA